MAKTETAPRKRRAQTAVYIGTENNKRKYKYFYGATKKEANKKALEYEQALNLGMNLLEDDTSWKQMTQVWLDLKEIEVSTGRFRCYQYSSKKFSELNPSDIKSVRTADLQRIVNEWHKMNPNTGRPSSRATLKEMKMSAIQIFQTAIDNRLLDYNAARAIKIPKTVEAPSRRALTKEEQLWIINTQHSAKRIAMVMMFAGLRRGEAIPLLWSDFMKDQRAIRVNKSASAIDGVLVVKPHTKNGKDRMVYIPNLLYDYLCGELKTTQSIYMFPSSKNLMMTINGFRRMWESYLTELNLAYAKLPIGVERPSSKFDPKKFPFLIPRITPHWLRHTYATMLYHSGVDVLAAKEQLGHSDIETTLQIYTHFDEQHKERALTKLNEYLITINA